MVDLTRHGIALDEDSWPVGTIANAQPPGRLEFLIRNRDLVMYRLTLGTIKGMGPFLALAIETMHPMTADDILTHPYPDTTRPEDAAQDVSQTP